jgi:hypothetical protein
MNDPPDDHLNWYGQLIGHTALVEGESLEATGTIESVEGATVNISCDQESWPVGERLHVTVSVFSSDALYRITGEAVSDEKVLHCGENMLIQRIQRRKWPRRRMDLPVTLCPVDDASSLHGVAGRTVDISVGGACVETLRRVEGEGDPMVILRLPDGGTIICAAATVAVEDLGDGWRYRLAFRDLDSADASRLQSLTAA